MSRVLAKLHQGQVKYLTTVAMVYADDTSLNMAGSLLELIMRTLRGPTGVEDSVLASHAADLGSNLGSVRILTGA